MRPFRSMFGRWSAGYAVVWMVSLALFYKESFLKMFWIGLAFFIGWFIPALMMSARLRQLEPQVLRVLLCIGILLALTAVLNYLLGFVGIAVYYQAFIIIPLIYLFSGLVAWKFSS